MEACSVNVASVSLRLSAALVLQLWTFLHPSHIPDVHAFLCSDPDSELVCSRKKTPSNCVLLFFKKKNIYFRTFYY